MKFENFRCIDCGSRFCPCVLAEHNQCILCNQARGDEHCHCQHWQGVCVYNELLRNGGKARKGRMTYPLTICEKKILCEGFVMLKINAPLHLLEELNAPGSFVFLRADSREVHYDTPISVMEVDEEQCFFSVVYETRGIKTNAINKLMPDDTIYVKGPFWNGVLGVDHINGLRNGKALIACRGIGVISAIQVVKRLSINNNRVHALIDPLELDKEEIEARLEGTAVDVEYISILDGGMLSDAFKEEFLRLVHTKLYDVCYLSAPDFLITGIMDMVKDEIKFACCNNAKMCCGEGICGACTARYNNRKVKKLCKVQTEPEYVFEKRWLL